MSSVQPLTEKIQAQRRQAVLGWVSRPCPGSQSKPLLLIGFLVHLYNAQMESRSRWLSVITFLFCSQTVSKGSRYIFTHSFWCHCSASALCKASHLETSKSKTSPAPSCSPRNEEQEKYRRLKLEG